MIGNLPLGSSAAGAASLSELEASEFSSELSSKDLRTGLVGMANVCIAVVKSSTEAEMASLTSSSSTDSIVGSTGSAEGSGADGGLGSEDDGMFGTCAEVGTGERIGGSMGRRDDGKDIGTGMCDAGRSYFETFGSAGGTKTGSGWAAGAS